MLIGNSVGMPFVIPLGNRAPKPPVVTTGTYSQTLSTATNGLTETVITPNGQVWRLQTITLSIPSPTGSTSGTHTLKVRDSSKATYINTTSAFSATLSVLNLPNNITISQDNALVIVYTNNTNAVQGAAISIQVQRQVI